MRNIIIPLYNGQPQMPDNAIFMGFDKKGFRYFQCPDRYIYQVYPDFDYWVNGKNRKNMFNGYLCSLTAWENSLNGILHTK